MHLKNETNNQTDSLFSGGFFAWAEKLAYVLFCLCILDCSLTGAGRYFTIGSLSPRIIMGMLALLLLLPYMVTHLGKLLKNPVLIAFFVFLVYLAICAVRGYLAGNMREVWVSDIKGFLWLFLVPVAVLTVNTPARLHKLLNCVLAGAIGQVILVLVATTVCSLPGGIMYLYYPFLDMGLGELFTLTSDITRVFLRSCPYMVFACSIALFRQIRSKRIHWFYMAVIILCLSACLLSFTRSLFGCIFVVAGLSVVFCLILYRKHWRRLVVCIAIVAVGFGAFTFTLEKIFDARFTAFAVCRTFGIPFMDTPVEQPPDPTDSTETTESDPTETTPPVTEAPPVDEKWEIYEENQLNSVTVRETTLAELTALIKQKPIFGNGLGASAPSRDGPDEYFYHDVLARMGLVGLVLYMAPFFGVLVFCLRRRALLAEHPEVLATVCGMCGFWAITFFNPWMNAALGIAMYAIFAAIPGVLMAQTGCSASE